MRATDAKVNIPVNQVSESTKLSDRGAKSLNSTNNNLVEEEQTLNLDPLPLPTHSPEINEHNETTDDPPSISGYPSDTKEIIAQGPPEFDTNYPPLEKWPKIHPQSQVIIR
ncbi:hypothetical protein L2E82_44779 [Cichorium intybus]|uniref:Uncharacterized protein n=1 Tax=Cichorium intybus TaxID=13427 RepID=A0ACB8ZR69_CICIN|nr:hypothetical protein L2E82_44779 [Cichorium intybus]